MSTLNASLASLTKNAKKTDKVKADRPSVNVPDDAINAFERFCYAKAVSEVAEARKDAESEIVEEIMLDEFSQTLFNNGFVPDNPKLVKTKQNGQVDLQGIFQVQQRYKYNIPKDVDGDEDITNRFVHALKAAGLTRQKIVNEVNVDVAADLVNKEIDARPVVMLRSFSELVEGHYENKTFIEASETEKAVGEKLLQFVLGNVSTPLTENERSIAVRQQDKIKVKDGFLQRIRLYCESQDEVNAVLKIITPTHFVSHVKVGVSDTPEQRTERLAKEAMNLFGVKPTVSLKQVA